MKGISVIIPTYNREKYVRQAIVSVLTQNYRGPMEVIISDDGSTDNTIKIAKQFGDKVKIIHNYDRKPGSGASATRNRGIKTSTQFYICFLDSDDFFLPNHLSKMVEKLEKNPSSEFVFCRCLEINETNNKKLYKAWTKEKISKTDIKHLIVSKWNVACTNSFLFKRIVFNQAGLFNENLSNAEDLDLWMRISERFEGVFSDHFGAVIRRHNQTQLTNAPKKKLLQLYYNVFKSALFRSNLKDPYRICKLLYLLVKYQTCQIPFIYQFYNYFTYYKTQNNLKNPKWHPLSYYSNNY